MTNQEIEINALRLQIETFEKIVILKDDRIAYLQRENTRLENLLKLHTDKPLPFPNETEY